VDTTQAAGVTHKSNSPANIKSANKPHPDSND